MKIIKIKSCHNCPYFGYTGDFCKWSLNRRILGTDLPIPNWCPLEDAAGMDRHKWGEEVITRSEWREIMGRWMNRHGYDLDRTDGMWAVLAFVQHLEWLEDYGHMPKTDTGRDK